MSKQFKLPFKSVSPKGNKTIQNNKSSGTNLKKVSKIKSPYKPKGITESGPVIKRVTDW